MQPLTPEFQKLLEIGTILGGVSTIGVIFLIVRIVIETIQRKKNGNPSRDMVDMLRRITETQSRLVLLGEQQSAILSKMVDQLHDIDRSLAVIKDRTNDGG